MIILPIKVQNSKLCDFKMLRNQILKRIIFLLFGKILDCTPFFDLIKIASVQLGSSQHAINYLPDNTILNFFGGLHFSFKIGGIHILDGTLFRFCL